MDGWADGMMEMVVETEGFEGRGRAGYFILPYVATFTRFMKFSKSPIAGCHLAFLRRPNLEHIWTPKWRPVDGLLKITKKHAISSKIRRGF